jgi:hypothetical protein
MESEIVERGTHLGGMSFGTFLFDMLFIVIFVMWIWLAITVMLDLFRRHDVTGLAKVLWVAFIVILPYLGVFAYLLTQSGGMATRNAERMSQARDELRRVVGFSVADELTKLEALKAEGKISDAEYQTLRARLV